MFNGFTGLGFRASSRFSSLGSIEGVSLGFRLHP